MSFLKQREGIPASLMFTPLGLIWEIEKHKRHMQENTHTHTIYVPIPYSQVFAEHQENDILMK